MYNLFSRNISKYNCSIKSLSHMYNTLFLKSQFNVLETITNITNIIKSIQEDGTTVKKVKSNNFCKYVMKDYGCQILNRSLLIVPSTEVIQIMCSSTSLKHFYLSTINQRKMDPITLTFVVYNNILHGFLKMNLEKKRRGEFFNGPGYITKFCRSLRNTNDTKDLESLEHFKKDRVQSINTNYNSQQPVMNTQQTDKISDSGNVQKLENYPQEETVLSKFSIKIPLMLEQPQLSKELTEPRHETNDFIVNTIEDQKLNLSPINTPTFAVSKRYFKKIDKRSKLTKIPLEVCKDVTLNPKKKSSNEKKIPAQACRDKIASKKAKRDSSTFFRSMNTGRLATPEMKEKKLKIIVSRYQFTTDNKPTKKVGGSKQICIPKASNPQQNMTYYKLKRFIEPAKQYIELIKVVGEIKIKNIKNQITQNFNELKNNPKEFLKSILLEQPEKARNDEKTKIVNLEKKVTITTITDQLKVEPKKPNNYTFLKILPVDKKPLIEKMKDSLETSIETDFKQTFGNCFKASKSKITLKALENLSKKEGAMKLLAIDKPPIDKLNLPKKQYFFKNDEKKRKEEEYLLQVGKEQKGVTDEISTASETFLKKKWLLSKDNYCGEAAKKSWFPLSKEMDEPSEKPEILFKNISKITRLVQLEIKKNDWLREVEVFSSQGINNSSFIERKSEQSKCKEKILNEESKSFPKNRLGTPIKEDISPASLLDKEERSTSITKHEGMSKELIKKLSEDDKSTNNGVLLAQERNEDKALQTKEGKRKPDRLERPFITPSHVPPPKKEEEDKKKKFPPPPPKGRMILPPRNVSDNPKLVNTDLSKNVSETKLPNQIKDDLNSATIKLTNKEYTAALSKNNNNKELEHDLKGKETIVSNTPKLIHKKFKDMSNKEEIKELEHQPKGIIIEKKSKVEIFSHLPRKSTNKLVYAKDSDLRKLISLEDKEHLRHNLRYILTLIEELDIEYKDGSDENLIKQSQEMDKIGKRRPKTEAKLNNSVSKVADPTNDFTKTGKHFEEKSSPLKIPMQEQDFPDRKIQEKVDKHLGSSEENKKAKLSTTSNTLETPEENTKVKFSPIEDPAKLSHFSAYQCEQLQLKNIDIASKENEHNNNINNIFDQNKSELDKKNVASTLMDFYRLDEEITSHKRLIQKPLLEENIPESSLMHFYLLDEDDRMSEKSADDPKTSNSSKKSDFQGIKATKQGILIEKAKNVALIKNKKTKTILPGEINKEGFKTNTFNLKEYQGIKETKQGILIEKQKNKVKNNTFKKLIKSRDVSKTKGDSIPENELLQKNEINKSIKPSTTRSLTSSSKNKKQKDLEKFGEIKKDEMHLRNFRAQELLTKGENKCAEEKYSYNLHKYEKLLSYNHGVKLIFGGGYEQHAKNKIEETAGISTLTDGYWKLHSDTNENLKYLFTQPQNFKEKTITTTLTSDKDDDIPPTKIKSDEDKKKQMKKKKRTSKKKKTTNDPTIKVTSDSKKRIKAPITIKKDPSKTPLVTIMYSKKRKFEKINKGVQETKRKKLVYKVNKKRPASSTRDKTRNRKNKKQKRRNIILFLLKDEIKRNEDWQAQIMERYMTPNEKVDQALNKYKFNTPTEVSNDFNTIPSADLEMNQRKRTKERLTDSFYKNLQKTFNSRRIPKSKSNVKSEKEKEVSSKEKGNNEKNSMLADNNFKPGSTYEHNDDENDSSLEPKSMHDCLSSGNISLVMK